VKELLPSRPVDSVVVEPWWIVQTGYIVEEDIKVFVTQQYMMQLKVDHDEK